MTDPQEILRNRLEEFGVSEPSKLTIPQLRSCLSEAGITLSQSNERKAYYVRLFKEHLNNDNALNRSLQEESNPLLGKKNMRSSTRELKDESSAAITKGMSNLSDSTDQNTKNQNANSYPMETNAQGIGSNKKVLLRSIHMEENDSDSISDSMSDIEEPVIRTAPKPRNLVRKRTPSKVVSNKRRKITNDTDSSVILPSTQKSIPSKESIHSKIDRNLSDNPFQKPSTIANGNQATSYILTDRRGSHFRESIQGRNKEIDNQNKQRISMKPSVKEFVSNELLENRASTTRRSTKEAMDAIFLPRRPAETPQFKKETKIVNASKISSAKYLVLVILLAIVALLIGIVGYQVYTSKQQNSPTAQSEAENILFCDNDPPLFITKNCTPCPEHGLCTEGRIFICEPGYKVHNNLCVEDEEISLEAYDFIEFLKPLLASHKGKYECGQMEKKNNIEGSFSSYTRQGIPFNQIKTILQEKYINNKGIQAIDRFEYVYTMLKNILETVSVGLKIEPVSEEIDMDTKSNLSDESYMIVSLVSSKPYFCLFKEVYYRNRFYIYGAIIIVILLFILTVYLQRLQSQREVYEDIAAKVLARLRKDGECVVVHLRDELKEKFKISDSTWHHVTDRIKSDSRIEEWINEENAEIWVWKSGVKTETEEK